MTEHDLAGSPRPRRNTGRHSMSPDEQRLVDRMAQVAEPFDSVDDLPLEALLDRIGDSRVVLLGEASHGTSEFYRARHRITRTLIEEQGFDFVVIEGDWPDVARIDHYVRHLEYPASEWTAFARFPTWMWRNEDVREFVDWLREHNAAREPDARVAVYGLDLYSLYQSIEAVVEYLDDVDPELAAFARDRYACLTPFKPEPGNYGRWAGTPGFADCEGTNEIVVDGQNGLLVDPGTDRVEAFATAVQLLIDDEAERGRLARQAPATVAAFRPGPIIDAWERMLLGVHRGEVAR